MRAQRREVYFTGQVQGVGFRYTTCRVASGFRVTGCVQNLSDGRVKMVVEGELDEVKAFVQTVQQEMADNILDVESQGSKFTGEFSSFEIRR